MVLEVAGPGGLDARDRMGSNSAVAAAEWLRVNREPLFVGRDSQSYEADKRQKYLLEVSRCSSASK